MEKHPELTWLSEARAYQKCPRCKIGNLDTRIHRGFLVKYFLGQSFKRYKCNNCGAKIYLKS